MKYQVILFIILTACSTKKPADKIQIPRFYLIHLRWDGSSENNNNFFYYNDKNICSVYFTDSNYSVSQKKDFNINKILADSIYLLAYNNSKNFDIADISLPPLIDGSKLSITLRTDNKSVENTYSGLSGYSVNNDINQIIRIIRQVTKDSTILD
ncbi:MAG: hypothetical protein H0U95_04475 [Bacteroidetes bacterium]|nr:hypothetical protein [Bacteroidota bacterium]